MWHTWRDLHEDRVREIAHDKQTANASAQETAAPERSKRHIGQMFRWFSARFNRRKLQPVIRLPKTRLEHEIG